MMSTEATPLMRWICARAFLSATHVARDIDSLGGPVSTRVTTGAAPISSFSTTGGSASLGKSFWTLATLSRTSCAARSALTSSSNSMITMPKLSTPDEVIRFTPEMVETASSIG